MRRTLRLTICLAAFLSTACAHPLSSLRAGMEKQNAYASQYVPPTADTAACRAGVAQLEAVAAKYEITVAYQNIPEQLGYARGPEKIVAVHVGLTSCGRLETLAHELAHMAQPAGLTQNGAQVFADSVSYLVVRELGGYDPKDRYLAYMGVLKEASRVAELYRAEIELVVKALTRKPVDLR